MALNVVLTLITTLFVTACWTQSNRQERHLQKAVRSDFNSEIITTRTAAYLSCESGEMVVKINFTQPYHGVTYANDRFSPCRFYGDGRKHYLMRIPLKGCGTKQEKSRVFINNVLVRFHPSLELEGDEIKTIICRYPPPLAPSPSNIIGPVIVSTSPTTPDIQPKLSEIDVLIIICSILFLTLLILGIGIAYFCLKKRNIRIVRRKRASSTAPSSEITKLSGGSISVFDPIRIPRATALSTAGSEAALLTSASGADRSDTLPSDYPSESPSSLSSFDDLDGRGSGYHTIDSTEPIYAQIQKRLARPSPPMGAAGHISKLEVRNIDDVFVTKTTEMTSTEHVTKKVRDITEPDTRDWDIVFRILHPPQSIKGADSLTDKDKETWKNTIVEDSRFRTLIREATTSQNLNLIATDHQYSDLYEPQKWSVIFRILSTPSDQQRHWKPTPLSPVPSSRANSFRSLTEVDVDFNHSDQESIASVTLSRTGRERSTSEYLEDIPVMKEHATTDRSVSEYYVQKNNRHRNHTMDRMDSNGSKNYSIVRVPSIGEREAVKSVTEEQVSDWQR